VMWEKWEVVMYAIVVGFLAYLVGTFRMSQ
jgi:hypothetical protein